MQALPGANPLSWGACGVNPSVHGVTQEQLSLVPSSPRVRKVKFTASLAQRELFAGKSNGIGKGVKVEPEGWRPPRLSPSVEAAEKQAVRVHGASLTPGMVSPSLEMFLLVFQAELPRKKQLCWEECPMTRYTGEATMVQVIIR